MEYKFLENELTYDGTQLRSHFANTNTEIIGDSFISFIGSANVKITEMVDLEDVNSNDFIKSKSMLHFIIEHFDLPLREMILRQRLLISICAENLRNKGINVTRNGDDLYINDKKLSVSIATTSPISSLIHTGINIDPEGAPVNAIGFLEFDINAKTFADEISKAYIDEIKSIEFAKCKVKPVF